MSSGGRTQSFPRDREVSNTKRALRFLADPDPRQIKVELYHWF